MKILDAYILARTKRKTRRIRTALVIVVSSLLFAVLFGGAFVAKGVVDGANQVKGAGFNGQYLTMVSSDNIYSRSYGNLYETVKQQVDNDLKARGIKITDKLSTNISYNVEINRRFSKAVLAKQAEAVASTEAWARRVSKPTAFYHISSVSSLTTPDVVAQTDPADDPLVDRFVQQEEKGGGPKSFTQDDMPPTFSSVESKMLLPQVQAGQTLAWHPGEAYPLIVTYSYLEKLSSHPLNRLSTQAKNEAYRQLIKQYTGKEITYCYRNSTASQLLQSIVHYNYTAKTDKDSSTKPIDIPVCGSFDSAKLKKLGITLNSSADDNGQKPLFPQPKAPDPVTRQIKFRLVGFVPGQEQFGNPDAIAGMLNNTTTWPLPNPAFLPQEVVKQEPLFSDPDNTEEGMGGPSIMYADFATRQDQKKLIAASCSGRECADSKKPMAQPFGNVRVALEGVFNTGFKFILGGTLGITVIAAIMIMFTISKVIADSIKEIAVFRAIGARRRDIAQIYVTYGLMLTVSSLVVSIVLALIGASVATHKFADRYANLLIQNTGAYTTPVHVNLAGIQPTWLLMVVGVMLLSSLIGIAIPVLLSSRRKLITILREE